MDDQITPEEIQNLIAEFRNQLRQKGIQGELLETAVADFVKFLENKLSS